MAAVVDLDLNRRPPSPEPAPPEEPRRAMPRQEQPFPDQVKDLHRLYWTQRNLTDGSFWQQSSDALSNLHSTDEPMMMNLGEKGNPDVSSNSNKRKRLSDVVEQNLDAKSSIRRKPDVVAREKCGYRNVIDLEKPATSDDEVEIVSSCGIGNLASHNGSFQDDSCCVSPENCPPAVCGQLCREQNACRVSPGSVGSSDTPGCHSPIKPNNTESRRFLIDLNEPQAENLHVSYEPPRAICYPLISSSSSHPGDFWKSSSKVFQKECGSSIGSLKGSAITVIAPSSAADSSREVVAAGSFHDSQNRQPLHVQASEHNINIGENNHAVDKSCGSSCQGCMGIPQRRFSASPCGGNDSSSGLHKSGDDYVAYRAGQPADVVHTEFQQETLTVVSDDEEKYLIDLNVSVGSIEMPSTITSNCREKLVNNDGAAGTVSSHSLSKKSSLQAEPFVAHPSVEDHHIPASKHDNNMLLPISTNNTAGKVQSPDSGTAINNKLLVPETPQVDNYVCPRLSPSRSGASNPQEAVSMPQAEIKEGDKIVSVAAETLLFISSHNSACIADCPRSNSQTAVQDGTDEPQRSLDSYEEIVLNLEEIRDDGESIPVMPPDKDGPSCGIKLKRGRGLRDFQREILPGLVSLARHEICDDMHAIGYELRKTRSRKTSGDQGASSSRARPPRRSSTARN